MSPAELLFFFLSVLLNYDCMLLPGVISVSYKTRSSGEHCKKVVARLSLIAAGEERQPGHCFSSSIFHMVNDDISSA